MTITTYQTGMMLSRVAALVVPLLALLAGVAAAQGGFKPPTFDGVDTDKSGAISQEEVVAFFKNVPPGPNGPFPAEATFDLWDENDDGTVSKAEFDARPRPPAN
jgi:hypothetical protein